MRCMTFWTQRRGAELPSRDHPTHVSCREDSFRVSEPWCSHAPPPQVNEKPFEDLKHCTAALTRGVVKFAQVAKMPAAHLPPRKGI